MKTTRTLALLAGASAIAAIVSACSSGGPGWGTDSEGQGINSFTGGAHLMPLKSKKPKLAAAPGAKLTYFGGPVISKVAVTTVFWNSSVALQGSLNNFYSSITNSAYFDWLTEYNTSSQTIGRGTLAGSVTDPSPPSGSSITDAQIQTELARLIDNGTLPSNADGNQLFAVHFPPGITITQGGGATSCVQFCAYHSTFVHGGNDIYYSIVPDQGGACAGGCGSGSQLQATTEVSSHELIESVTDSAVGLASSIAAPLAWYDQANGEIGDICNGMPGTVNGFQIQLEWSNANNACIATGPGGVDAGTDSGKDSGKDTGGGDTGTDSGGTCAHGICATGTKLVSTCDPCATKICGSDPFCCNTQWDNICVGEVASICGESCTGGGDGGTDGGKDGGKDGGTTCAHPICSTGKKLTPACDPCAKQVCASDSFCCQNTWDSICVSEVGSICGETCP